MRRNVEKLWVRLLALALFFLFTAVSVLAIGMYRYALEDGWYSEGEFTFADTLMAKSYVMDALGFVEQNMRWLQDPENEDLGGYGGDAFAYIIKDENTGEICADTTTEASHFVTEYYSPIHLDGLDGYYRLSGYVNLPVQPYGGCYREYYLFEHVFPLRHIYLPCGIVCALLAAVSLAVAAAGCVCLGKRGVVTPLGRLPFDGAALAFTFAAEVLGQFVYGSMGYSMHVALGHFGIYDRQLSRVLLLWAMGMLLLVLLNQLAAGGFWQRLLLRRAMERLMPMTLVLIALGVHALLNLCLLARYYGVDFILSRTLYVYGTPPILCAVLAIDAGALLCFLRWDREKERIREASGALASGKLTYKVNEDQLHFVWRELGRDLNRIGDGMALAVEERLRSERMKTELITNVSHDLKTPLTSIINYIELLKGEDLSPEVRQEYLQVLERQSAKLKKLTEDVIDASKAASGVMPVHKETLDVRELLGQSVGEYAQRLEDAQITPVLHLPEQETAILADGRLLGRVLDNLIGNILKYAQPGTRAYFDLTREGDGTVIAVKNTSRAPLDIPAEELMERFVRGDSSRSTEGSGLGLSIARSLMELMGGQLRLILDGDLFKAELFFPDGDGLPALPQDVGEEPG